VDIIHASLAPLGSQYVDTLRAGLLGGWVDRYENKGKHSGAFSAGGFTGEPYILMNYKTDVMRDVFTLAHEGGHSMHSWYAARSNPFLSYSYSIFEAEVASTFNEQLVFRHLYDHATDNATRIFLLLTKIDDLIGTLYRQTMFAEFEQYSHAMLESGEALTLENLRSGYRALLVKYFGPTMILEDVSDLEGLRIPHFYGAFYVYKYATGISASIALARRVLQGGNAEREDYFRFLRSGGSRYPIEALALAGVDMSTPEPIQAACTEFDESVQQLARLLEIKLP
jgi:oligoendopeptidase F